MVILLSALVLGLMGSFHCAGMCGPIAIALPLHGNSIPQKIFGGTLYNLGRTLTYGVMGAIFGLLGQGVQMIGFQQKISVVMGAIMIISVIFPSLFRNQYNMEKSWFSLVGKLKKSIGRLFSVRSFSSLFFIGLLNGLLPCGLVYMAIAGAIGTGEVVLGSLYMIMFGLGTIPMMLSIAIAGNILNAAIRQKINRLIPVLVVVVGIFFILRGLSLGIPYLSPPREKIEKKFEKSLDKENQVAPQSAAGGCCTFYM
jgi:sulfite exporter TauE/SafE